MIKCMIVDDEKPARDELRFLLEDFEDIEVVREASSGPDACQYQKEDPVDLVFLDINMPVITGVRVAEKWMSGDNPPMIVFTTAYDEFAIRAFELNAVDYLLKPISGERLRGAIEKARERNIVHNKQSIKAVIEKMDADHVYEVDKICLENGGKFIPVETCDIIYATIVDKHTTIYTVKGIFTYAHSLSHLEEKLHNDRFFRSHRAYLMNVDFVEAIEPWFNNTYMVKMKFFDEKVPVARNQIKSFKETFHL
ncbi:LytR/AlgR family response regulator transcription factor [Fusibacter sp. JL216-2]|uniref:LytR/AlgR family response regulator transcription factor n=1 Tax=Fusibacter sp. JL216-2 TaxID=3071453 RepID=UPI003D33C863